MKGDIASRNCRGRGRTRGVCPPVDQAWPGAHEKNFLIFSFSPLGNDEKMSRFMKEDILLSADKQRRPRA
jgi:hypothetical protein